MQNSGGKPAGRAGRRTPQGASDQAAPNGAAMPSCLPGAAVDGGAGEAYGKRGIAMYELSTASLLQMAWPAWTIKGGRWSGTCLLGTPHGGVWARNRRFLGYLSGNRLEHRG